MNKHSKLPLRFEEKIGAMKEPVIELYSANGFYIGGLRRPFSGQILAPDATDVMRANAAHIVRCVNSHEALVNALTALVQFDSYETEYDGRMYTICSSCGAQLSEGKQHSDNCDFTAARAVLAAAGTAS